MNADYATIEQMVTWAEGIMQSRICDFPIGGRDDPYIERWWVIPRNAMQNVYLHRILRDDDDRALHDHPSNTTSIVLQGSYREITRDGTFIRVAGDVVHRPADALHRLELIDGAPCVSLFMMGPKIREWGFACPNGWVHWRDFTGGEHGELVGRGCGE